MSVAETLAAMHTEALIDLVRCGLDDDEETARQAANRRWLGGQHHHPVAR
ncbi:hypothetical protein [Actinomadura sp. 3N407]